MSKKNKQTTEQVTEVKSTPTIYHGINTNTATRPNVCIMEDLNGHFSLHNSRSSIEKLQSFNALIKESIQKIWENFNKFTEENRNTILTYHANLFNSEPDKERDIVITAMLVWNKMIATATADLTTEVPVIAGRKSTIGNCEYRPGKIKEGDGQLKTPQAKACLKMFRQCLTDNADSYPPEDPYVTEAVLRQYIIDHAAELHTRQDPWRIFQYYRPSLMAEHLITRK